jgi:Leucine-rich repeat (LRR) protein
MGGETLGALPPTIGQLTHLELLHLRLNNLERLPDEFGALTALKTLNLADNLFETFPTILCHLSQLQELNLSGNFLQHLPEEIQQMAGLECLRLGNNLFAEFPRPLCTLSHLKQLSLWGSHIDQIPDGIGRLTALEEWHLQSDQPLHYVSPQVQQLANLRCLRYDYSQAGTANDEKFMFPVTLCRIPNLRNLTISTNKVLIIPDEIQQLQQLEELVIDNYQLETLNPAIFRLSRLKTLRLPSSRLESIPAEIEQLQTLEELYWISSLNQVPEVLTRLPHLKKLEVSRYGLDEGVKAWLREHLSDIISII